VCDRLIFLQAERAKKVAEENGVTEEKAAVVFASHDRDGSATLSTKELRQALKALGVDVTTADVALQLEKFDADGATPSRSLFSFNSLFMFPVPF